MTQTAGKKLNIDAPAWTPSFGGATSGASTGLAEMSLPASNLNHANAANNDEHDAYEGGEHDEHAELDEYYDDEFVTEHNAYEQQESDWHQHQEWATMMQQQQQYGFSNAAALSGGVPLPPPPASMFPGGKVPQTAEEWETFNTELKEMQKKQIEKQIEERKARDEARRARDAKNGKVSTASNAPLTVNGKHRWPKNSAAKKAETAQKAAFESFANALLHSVSPFMAPLRKLTKTSLPHIKVDQRFGRRGQPETAVMQFIVAPVVVNYKPAHFHEVSPGDLLEFHYDFAQVLGQLRTVNSIAISYGPTWKPFQLPYCFVGCREYAKEVRQLCPEEVPNGRSEAVYEDDVVRDITAVICAVQELETLSKMSIVDAMKSRVNLVAMYDVFNSLFENVGEYQIQIRNINNKPSQYLLKTSLQVLQKYCPLKPHIKSAYEKRPDEVQLNSHSFEVVIGGDKTVWDDLPTVPNTFQSGKTVVVSVGPEETKTPPALAISKTPESSVIKQRSGETVNPSSTANTRKDTAPASSGSKKAPMKVGAGSAVAIVSLCVAATAAAAAMIIKNAKK